MPSLWDPPTRDATIARIERLAPRVGPLWGRMQVEDVLPHLADVQRIALGEIETVPAGGVRSFRPVAYAIIHWMPWPKARVTAPPEAFRTAAVDLERDREELVSLIRRFAERDPSEAWPVHPLFGKLSGSDWGVFCYRHLDHHLRQFGC